MLDKSEIQHKYPSIMDRVYYLESIYNQKPIPYNIIFKAFRELNKNEAEAKSILKELEDAGIIRRMYGSGIICLKQ